MDARSLPILDGLAAAMAHHARRQQVIAENLANADTPGFKARDLAPLKFAAIVEGGIAAPKVTVSERARALGAGGGGGELILSVPTETKPGGNNVTIETELMNMADVQAGYTAAAMLYRKSMGILRAALGRGA